MDEVGFGRCLYKYAYSPIGKPVVYHKEKELSKNLSCTATISTKKVELIQFFYKGGTTNESYYYYYNTLIEKMKRKYAGKYLVFIADNLAAHKSSLVLKILNNEDNCTLLMTPSNSPELSPIENMFSKTKSLLKK